MKARFSPFLDRIRSSYWFVPAVMSLMAVVLSTLMLSLDRRYADRIPSDAWWLYGGGDEGARVVLSAIVTSMISVTSVVFSPLGPDRLDLERAHASALRVIRSGRAY